MLLRSVFQFILISLLTVVYCEEQWQIDENEIFLTAQQENQPVIAVFVGGVGCPWSQKLVHDVLENACFIDKIGRNAILWEISLGKESQDHAMRQKYGIKECPQIVLLDPKGKEFARIEYAPLGAAAYADEIITLIDNFQEICIALDQKEGTFEEEPWKDLYLKAKKLSVPCFKQVMLERGLKKERGTFFHCEKLASLLEKHKLKYPQVLKLKGEMLKRDPEDKLGTQFKIAAIEFQKIASCLKPKDRYEKALKPLFQYVQRFAKKGPENLWRAELMIAEFLFTKNSLPLALEHAGAAYNAAPESAKGQIAETISLIKRNEDLLHN